MAWQFNPNHSQFAWAGKWLKIMTIRGTFTKWSAQLQVDGDDPGQWSVTATIDVNSLESQFGRRDETFRGPDWFDAERCPTITFQSTRFARANGGYRVTGDLTIKDVTREITLDMDYAGEATDPRGNRVRVFTTDTTLKRTDFGVGAPPDPSGAAGDEIAVSIQFEAVWKE